MSERYFVDERAGCVAVRDRTKTKPQYQGLHCDTLGVIRFWSKGSEPDRCPTCGHDRGKWADGAEQVAEATELCRVLNEKEIADAGG